MAAAGIRHRLRKANNSCTCRPEVLIQKWPDVVGPPYFICNSGPDSLPQPVMARRDPANAGHDNVRSKESMRAVSNYSNSGGARRFFVFGRSHTTPG